MRNPARRIRLSPTLLKLKDELYAKIPAIDCMGLCSASCGSVPMTEFEWDRMVVAHGKIPLATVGTGDCPFLNAEKKCEHHDVRPGLCRLWGVVQAPPMECPHGCRPKRYLSDDEAFWIMKELDRIGGGITVKQLELIQ